MNVPMNRSLMILIMACVSFENCDKLQMILVCYLLVLSKYSPGLATLVTLGHRRQFVGIINSAVKRSICEFLAAKAAQ